MIGDFPLGLLLIAVLWVAILEAAVIGILYLCERQNRDDAAQLADECDPVLLAEPRE